MWKTRVRVLLVTSALSAGLAAGLGAPAASAATCGTTTSTTIPQSCSGSAAKPKPPTCLQYKRTWYGKRYCARWSR
jgi:hypothetical protein